jgi:hypothetical protein
MAFCGQCGSAVAEGHAFCRGCGTRVDSQPSATTRTAVAAAPALEKTFYQDPGVLITNSRCIVAGQTYAMSGITSVRPFTEVPPKGGPILLIIVGVFFTLGSLPNLPNAVMLLLCGIGMIAGGIAWFKSKKDIYHVVVHSASGESRLIHSIDQSYITQIIAGLNEAIVYRS